MTLNEFLKNIILLLILAYISPFLINGITKAYHPFLEPTTSVGLITITQPLTSSLSYTADINAFFKNPDIKGIVIIIDCNSSAAGTSHIIFHELQELKKEFPKPLICLVENECFEGAYLIATACDYIIAPETALIGKIGHYALPESLQKTRLKKEDTDHELYQQLTKQIATARKLSLTTVNNWANEQLFTGKQALNLGLINALGSMQTVIKIIKEKVFVEGDINWVINATLSTPNIKLLSPILTNVHIGDPYLTPQFAS